MAFIIVCGVCLFLFFIFPHNVEPGFSQVTVEVLYTLMVSLLSTSCDSATLSSSVF